MDPIYREQASQLLQITLQATKIQNEQPLSLLQLSFANKKHQETAIERLIARLPAKRDC